jgi:hypothetical protein
MFLATSPEKFDTLTWLIDRAGELGLWTTSALEIARHVGRTN